MGQALLCSRETHLSLFLPLPPSLSPSLPPSPQKYLPRAKLGVITQFLGAWALMLEKKAEERFALLPDVFVSLLSPVQLGEYGGAFELVDGLDVADKLAFLFEDEVGAARINAIAA